MFMGNELTIDCPHCGEGFELTEALAGPLLEAERKQARIQALKSVDAERTAIAETVRGEIVNEYAAEIRARDAVIADRDAKVKVAQEAELAARKAKDEAELAKQRIELDVQRRVDAIRNDVAAEAAAKATEEVSAKLSLAEASIADKDARLRIAQQAELAARKAKEEAEQARQETEVSVQRRVDEARADIAAEALRKATDAYDAKLAVAQASLAEKDAQLLTAQQAELAARKAKEVAEGAKQQVELDVQRRVDAIRSEVAEEAAKNATTELTAKLIAAQVSLAEKDVKLVAAQSAEIEARRLKAEAQEAMRETELTVARRLDEERTKVRDQALRERDDEYRLKLGDKETQLRAMQEQIEELRRRGSQATQQLAGDVLEVDLFNILQDAFPSDRLERVRKGQRGADVLHTVRSAGGLDCGTILWESKRTKNWNEPWLAKLREDQREIKADVAALASETLPDGVASFAQREGIWVTSLGNVIPVGSVLRHGIIEVATTRRTGALADSTKDLVFAYLTSPQFRQRITRVTETYVEMRSELDREKRAASTQFSKREKQLERVMGGITGFYGDLQGIVGSSLPPVAGLMLNAAEEPTEILRLAMVNSDAVTSENATERSAR
jgi:hypothetical protein